MTPIRTCVVCRSRRGAEEMVRAGRDVDGRWYQGPGVGRGLWWCRGTDCVERVRVGHVARALRADATEADVAQLRALRGRS